MRYARIQKNLAFRYKTVARVKAQRLYLGMQIDLGLALRPCGVDSGKQ